MRKKSAEPTGNHQGNPRVHFVLRIAIAAALGGFLFGYDTAVINGAVSAIQSTFNAYAINLTLMRDQNGDFQVAGMPLFLGTFPMVVPAFPSTLRDL